jgi:hypothetical protein
MKKSIVLAASLLLSACVYDPYTNTYVPAGVAYPAYPAYAATAYPAYPYATPYVAPYPFVTANLFVGRGWGWGGWRGGYWGGGGWGGWHGGGWHGGWHH